MDVDVTYEGLILMRGATLTTTPNGPFIGLSAPMPVGTNLVLKKEGASCAVRVARVQEGTGAGMFITPIEPIERLVPGAAGEPPPSEPPPAPTPAAEEASAVPAAAADPAEVPQAPEMARASAPEATSAPQEATGLTETWAPGDEVETAPAAAMAAAADASAEASPPAAPSEAAPAFEAAMLQMEETAATAPATGTGDAEAIAERAATAASEAAPLEPPPVHEASANPEAMPGAVAQEMDPRIVTAPVATADILEEMPATNTGPVQAPKKKESARDSDGDANKRGRRRGSGRGGKKR
jgi:hypothetical protein